MTEDRHDELAAMNLSVISVNFNSYASLVIYFIILVMFCFVFDHEILLTI